MLSPIHDDLLWSGLRVVAHALGPNRVARTALGLDGDVEATLLFLAARGLTSDQAAQLLGRTRQEIIGILAADAESAWNRLVKARS